MGKEDSGLYFLEKNTVPVKNCLEDCIRNKTSWKMLSSSYIWAEEHTICQRQKNSNRNVKIMLGEFSYASEKGSLCLRKKKIPVSIKHNLSVRLWSFEQSVTSVQCPGDTVILVLWTCHHPGVRGAGMDGLLNPFCCSIPGKRQNDCLLYWFLCSSVCR